MSIFHILLVFLGSGLGGVCRWALSLWGNGSYPCGTLAANVLGCLLVGLGNAWISRLGLGAQELRLLLVVGFCGGFTTFSAFLNESFLLLRGTQLPLALAYTALSLCAGLAAVWLGNRMG